MKLTKRSSDAAASEVAVEGEISIEDFPVGADNPLAEISVCLKPRFHARANGSRSVASSSFRLSRG